LSTEPHAATYADRAWHGTVTIQENVVVARDTYRVRFACPEIARRIVPGQFLMLRFPGCASPLLGRPLALYQVVDDAAGRPDAVDVVYLAVGRMTRRLAALGAWRPLEVWGPLGNGFLPVQAEHLVMVAGGIGQTPFAGPDPQRIAVAEESRCIWHRVGIKAECRTERSSLAASRASRRCGYDKELRAGGDARQHV